MPLTRNFLWSPSASTGWTPKVSKGRPESPLVASAEAKSPEKQKKKERLFPLPPQETCFLWEVSPACGRTRYFPRAGKYPKGAGGGQRVHAAWPPPDPPLLSYSAPLASQGRAQLGSHPSLGGPLSPSAQSIPPPAFGRRLIPGVMARARGSRNPPGPRRIAALHAAGYGEQQGSPTRIG